MKLIHMNLWQPDSNNPITRAGYPGGDFSSYGGEVMVWVFLGSIVIFLLYLLFKYGDPSKMDGGK